MAKAILDLGITRPLAGSAQPAAQQRMLLPAHHLVTHGVVVGMTGSGKTGLVMVTVEEALRAHVPVVMIDVKGDLPNLLLAFPDFAPEVVLPYVEAAMDPSEDRGAMAVARDLCDARRVGLAGWGLGDADVRALRAGTHIRVLTPGSSAGEALHVLSGLEQQSGRWATDPESAQASLVATISLVLRLLGRESDPAKSKEHVLLSVLAERRLAAGQPAHLAALLGDVIDPPIDRVGELPLDDYISTRDRKALAAALNSLLASPSFKRWRTGTPLDAAQWFAPHEGRTSATIISVAHLDDEERALVLGLVLEELLSHVRSLAGSQSLRALIVFDEVYGFLPPYPANPPTKRPIVALMKQARAFGVGVVLATQNPMDIDYRALSNAGLWCIGRLQTDADRERVVEGISGAGVGAQTGETPDALKNTLKVLKPRWFVVRDAHSEQGLVLLQARYAMSWLRGPMTRGELRMALEAEGGEVNGAALASLPDRTATSA